MIVSVLRRFARETDGGPAAEFAMLVPGIAFLLFGTINLFLMMYSWANLNSAAEFAARKAAIYYNMNYTGTAGTGTPSATTVTGWGRGAYIGPNISATFTLTQATNPYTTPCKATGTTGGNAVAGAGSYDFYYGFGKLTVPLKANACYS